MRTRHLNNKSLERREIPATERKIIEPLVERMESFWRCRGPLLSSLAPLIVYGRSFMGIDNMSEFFPKVLGKGRLLDLGAGEAGPMIHFALRSGVGEYVAVDRFWSYKRTPPPFHEVSLVNSDMLMFLAEQPDSSASIVMNAIDEIVLSGPGRITEALYQGMLLAEIKRVVPLGGIVFGFNCHLFERLAGLGFQSIENIPGHPKIMHTCDSGIYMRPE